MLIEPNSHLYSYAITRDLGFAPNPFHGICTLATCKPDIRKKAKVGDWIMGIGGSTLRTVKRQCILLMKVSEKMSFQEYWDNDQFALKKSIRNGSDVQLLGDNIYHKDENGNWIQENSHHSLSDGTPNLDNLKRDTGKTDQVLISRFFLYFGNQAQAVDLDSIGYGRVRNYKQTDLSNSEEACNLITAMLQKNRNNINVIVSEPCQFFDAHKRVDQITSKLS